MAKSYIQTPSSANKFDRTIDFTRKWFKADVALLAQDSTSLLHVNKDFLAIHSPFFDSLFFSNFAESNQEVVKIGVNYNVLLQILKILHNLDRNFFEEDEGKELSPDTVVELYMAADQLDISMIRYLCKEFITKDELRADTFEMAWRIGLEGIGKEDLFKMTSGEIRCILTRDLGGLTFTPEEVIKILNIEREEIRIWH